MGRPITHLHQIELTSECNLRCVYCVHPTMPRAKLPMTEATWQAALRHVQAAVDAGTQGALNLAGIGESTLHPRLAAWAMEARAVLGPGRLLALATNGVAVTPELVAALVPSQIAVWVSLHRPEKAGPAVRWFAEAGLLRGVSADPVVAPMDWAGQVDWHTQYPVGQRPVCEWLRDGWGMVAADGRILTCCTDGQGTTVLGHVTDPVGTVWTTGVQPLCATCWLAPPAGLEALDVQNQNQETQEGRAVALTWRR